MAEILLKYFKYIGEKKGLAGKLELARKTKIPSAKAAFEPDTPELIDKFRREVEAITGEKTPKL